MKSHDIEVVLRNRGMERGVRDLLIETHQRISAQDATIKQLALLIDKLVDITTATTHINEKLRKEIEGMSRTMKRGTDGEGAIDV